MSVCPKCQSAMKRGFILDHTYGYLDVATWVEGEPERSFWSGLKTHGRKMVKVETWRCSKCGFLESYAKERS